ncbi:DNA-directed RNA polymerase subunit beta' [bacterium]|nr:DNA-directed RNA polymerase subunit beta' [bacterium]
MLNEQKTEERNAALDFDSISLKLASPENIIAWSYGEVTKPETINYRTGRSERGGLFDERIFGPEKDYECYCGKYRRIRYKGIICEKCGVEVTRSIVRRERMGHIVLASPVAHIWFLRNIPSRMGLILDISLSDLEKVIYFAGYIITEVHEDERARVLKELDQEYKKKIKIVAAEEDKDKLRDLLTSSKRDLVNMRQGVVLDELVYHRLSLKYGTVFRAGIGAEAVYELFKKLNLLKLEKIALEKLEKATALERDRVQRRLSLIRAMIKSGVRPEWMFLTAIPVIPPALRPMVPLDGGRHATSDVNDLYRRVINRNNRLAKLKDLGAPDVILRNEKRILQEAVDALIDNSMRRGLSGNTAMSQVQRRALKSLSDTLKGKQGYFRRNLLGKRVDYSGRSVIVVGPALKLNECGLPKHMALELFRPFVISELIKMELAYNIRGAGRLIDEGIPEVWAILENVIKGKYVLLNRAPTLHRLGIQAFNPRLVEGNAIQIHPLICPAFNADFDGDQMAVHVPLSERAQKEAGELMAANKNLLGPGNGLPIVSAKMLDIVLGSFWVTKEVKGEKGEGEYFPSPNAAITAFDFRRIAFRAKIFVMGTESEKYKEFEGKPFETTVGRLLFNSTLPKDFPYINKEMDRRAMASLIDDLIERYGIDGTPPILDKIKDFGFRYVTYSGITWGIDDISVPEGKKKIIAEGAGRAEEILSQYNEGLLSATEKYRKTIEIWQGVKTSVDGLIPDSLDKNGSVFDMVYSGARGSFSQIGQMAGMKGLITSPTGRIIDFPIAASYKEGLTPLEYFITTHGARKGLTDTALNTAKAGYLTRRLVDVAQEAIITEEDCGEKNGRRIAAEKLAGIEVTLSRNIRGRILAKDVSTEKGELLFKKGALLSKKNAETIEHAGVKEVFVRSPLTCETLYGLCQKCYGLDLGRNTLVSLGEAVGIVAAQAIGEPGTQLTMRTFHTGGIASVGGDITQGLPRVEEIFERRTPKAHAIIATTDGEVMDIRPDGKDKIIEVITEASQDGAKKKSATVEYAVPFKRMILVKKGDKVAKGDLLTDGSGDIGEVFKYGGQERAERYIINEIGKVYELQGANIARKHIEVIVRQMFSRRKVVKANGTDLTPGDVVERFVLAEKNRIAEEAGREPAETRALVLGISEVSLTTKSFLSAASFQNTTRILINAAVRGGVDDLRGLKENVIIGRLIPAGTGYNEEEESEGSTEDR